MTGTIQILRTGKGCGFIRGNAAIRHIRNTRGIGGAFAELHDDRRPRRCRCRSGGPDLHRRAGHCEAAGQADCDELLGHRKVELQAAVLGRFMPNREGASGTALLGARKLLRRA